jgi:hypothetical protein
MGIKVAVCEISLNRHKYSSVRLPTFRRDAPPKRVYTDKKGFINLFSCLSVTWWCNSWSSWLLILPSPCFVEYRKQRYNTLNYWVFGLLPSSGIVETRKKLLGNWISFQWLRLALSKGPNGVGVFAPHLRTETDPFSETSCFLVSRIPDDGQSPKTQEFWVLYTIIRTL